MALNEGGTGRVPASARLHHDQLAALADVLKGSLGIFARVYAPFADAPFLDVRNLQSPMRTQRITVQDGKFVDELGRKIGPATEPATVAIRVVQAVRSDNPWSLGDVAE